VSKRTLARRLASEGLTFATVLRHLRSDLAKRHLADRDLSVSKIAWLLGYRDVNTFTNVVQALDRQATSGDSGSAPPACKWDVKPAAL
jgi:AraC-like DNA-binding protein